MYCASCPQCGLSDGNNDKVISEQLIFNDYVGAEIIVTKECDICRKIYKISKKYRFDYEEVIY